VTHRATVRDALHEAALAILGRLSARALCAEGVRHLGPIDHLWSLGKAAIGAAQGVIDEVGFPRKRRLVITKHGHGDGRALEGGHPLPDLASLRAGEALLAAAQAVEPGERVVIAVTGGASAVAALPAFGLTLDDKIAATQALLAAGVEIDVLNAVRKHCSAIKGGRLAAATRGEIHALLLGDVVSNDPSVIGSGPVIADSSTYADALAGASAAALPPRVRDVLVRGARGELPETPKQNDPSVSRVHAEIVASPARLLAEATSGGRGRLFRGPAEALAAEIRAASRTPGRHVWVGEPTVVLPPQPGRGGRAQHVALLAAEELGAATLLCLATDGSDGPTADAGAIVDGTTWDRVRGAGIDPRAALRGCDAGTALAAAGDLLTLGPTGTNLTDLYVLVL
jgi:glycerate 2-kinase